MLDAVRTLVLDGAFQAVSAIDWRRAIVLDLMDRVVVLEYYDEVVHTAHRTFPLPAVIQTPGFVRKRPLRVPLTRGNLLLRDEQRCQYCGVQPPLRQLTVDHVLPRSRGGQTSWDNVVTACGPCNRRKGNRTPREAGMPLPRRPSVPRALAFGHQGLWLGVPPDEWKPYLPEPPG